MQQDRHCKGERRHQLLREEGQHGIKAKAYVRSHLLFVLTPMICAGMLVPVSVAGLFLLALVTPASSQPKFVEILEQYDDPYTGEDEWKWGFVSADGTARRERGKVTEDGSIEVEGAYRYTDPDGKLQEVAYTAGKNGYRPFPPKRICNDRPEDELCLESIKSLVGRRRRRKIIIRVVV